MIIVVGERGRWIGEAAREASSERAVYFANDNAQAVRILREVLLTDDMI